MTLFGAAFAACLVWCPESRPTMLAKAIEPEQCQMEEAGTRSPPLVDCSKYLLEILGTESQGNDGTAVSFGVTIRNASKNQYVAYSAWNDWRMPNERSTSFMRYPKELAPEKETTVLGPAFDLGTANRVIEIYVITHIDYGFAGEPMFRYLEAEHVLSINPSDLSLTNSRLLSTKSGVK